MLVLSGCASAGADLMTFNGIRESSRDIGAHKTVRLMNEGDRAAWENFIQHLASGDEAWLQVLPDLLGGSDAGWTGSIITALAAALPKNPEGVLALEGAFVSMKQVCSIPFIEPEDKFVDDYVLSVKEALAGVNDAYFEQDKLICLQRLDETMKIIELRRKGEYKFK